MARTKQTARRSTGGKAPRKKLASGSCRWGPQTCYGLESGIRHVPTPRNGRHSQLPESHCQDTASSKIMANFKGAKDFLHFVKFPNEIQNRVWELVAEEPRVVAVSTKTIIGRRFRSSIPPILHVCSESRAVGLKHYTLAFESQQLYDRWTDDPEYKNDPPPGGVYFNFERDTLYLRENWNENVGGAWCCLSQFTNLVNESDLKRVKRVGLDVNARVCSLKTSSENCHLPNFAGWEALEILYLGYEDMSLGSDCLINFGALESKDYEDFIQRYRMNPGWRNGERLPRGAIKAVEYLRNEVPIMYQKPACFLRKLELVSIKHL